MLDGHLSGRAHVACGRLTIADFQLASMATYWQQSAMPLEAFPNIVRWIDWLMRLPAWADPWPADRQRWRNPAARPAVDPSVTLPLTGAAN